MAWNIVYRDPATNVIDFAAQSTQDPLSIGGTWSNNTQGVGGNTAPGTGTSMRIASATGGGLIAMASVAAHADYEDSFAFLPNLYSGNFLRVWGKMRVVSGYSPVDNHEIELILGCSTNTSYHRWIECLWSMGGNQQTINQDGDFNLAAVTDISSTTGLVSGPPVDGQWMVAELYLSTTRVRWGVSTDGTLGNTTWAQDVTNALIASLGNGGGIAAFRRSGDTVAASLGFSQFKYETS